VNAKRNTSRTAPFDILVLGELDCGNLGNDGSFEALLDGVRTERPGTTVKVFGYGNHALGERLGVAEEQMNAPRRGRHIPAVVEKALLRLGDFPRTARRVRQARIVVVAGAGVFEGDHATVPTGWPLAFWRTAIACRVLRRPLLLIGVGASPVKEGLSRRLYASGIKAASLVTYRDSQSRDVARDWVGDPHHGTVSADLAFAGVPAVSDGHRTRPLVAVGVMADGGGIRGANAVAHTAAINRIVTGLLDRGRDVSLIIGDEMDRPVLTTVADAFADDSHVSTMTPSTLKELVAHVADTEAVIATRFHNIVAGLSAARPVVAISYAAKTKHLMARVGQGDLVVGAADLDSDAILCLYETAIAANRIRDPDLVDDMRALAVADIQRVVEALR
jgi:polysaccharide pyruvyl transferase WcaK-like protein